MPLPKPTPDWSGWYGGQLPSGVNLGIGSGPQFGYPAGTNFGIGASTVWTAGAPFRTAPQAAAVPPPFDPGPSLGAPQMEARLRQREGLDTVNSFTFTSPRGLGAPNNVSMSMLGTSPFKTLLGG